MFARVIAALFSLGMLTLLTGVLVTTALRMLTLMVRVITTALGMLTVVVTTALGMLTLIIRVLMTSRSLFLIVVRLIFHFIPAMTIEKGGG